MTEPTSLTRAAAPLFSVDVGYAAIPSVMSAFSIATNAAICVVAYQHVSPSAAAVAGAFTLIQTGMAVSNVFYLRQNWNAVAAGAPLSKQRGQMSHFCETFGRLALPAFICSLTAIMALNPLFDKARTAQPALPAAPAASAAKPG